jgi:hypothetical protein
MKRVVLALSCGALAAIAATWGGCAHSRGGDSDTADGGLDPDAGAGPDVILGDASSLGTDPTDAPLTLDAACAHAKANVLRDPIYALIVLDGSGSMSEESKWAAVVPALDAFIDDLQSLGDKSFGLGLTIFSDSNDPTQGNGPYPNFDVPIAFVDLTHAQALHARLDHAAPAGQTPTLAVLTGQYAQMEAFTPPGPLLPNGTKVVVLMTDGVPYPNTETQKQPSIQAALDERQTPGPKGPITTFAVGIGHYFPLDTTTYDPQFMGALAMAGGAPNQPCSPSEVTNVANMCHFQITPAPAQSSYILEQQFRSALDKIRSRVTSCTLSLERADGGPPVDPKDVNVVFTDTLGNEQVILEDPKNGWSYDDPNAPAKVILNGSACTLLKNNPDGKLEAVLGCASITK